jgi:hypothetical protein
VVGGRHSDLASMRSSLLDPREVGESCVWLGPGRLSPSEKAARCLEVDPRWKSSI